MPTEVHAAPVVFDYHDYRAFLTDWLAAIKASQSRFSMRALSRQAQLASGYLPMVLQGKRNLSEAAVLKLLPHMGLKRREQEFFQLLVSFGNTRSPQSRIGILARMRRFREYRRANPNEAEVQEYLTHWYYVAIREMTGLAGFRADPQWIQDHLRFPVEEKDIKKALTFLSTHGYIELDGEGGSKPPDKEMVCVHDVYRTMLAHFHREIFKLAIDSIATVPSEERHIMGYTLPIRMGDVPKAKQIVEDAIAQLRQLSERKGRGDAVYQIEMALLPLSQPVKKGDSK